MKNAPESLVFDVSFSGLSNGKITSQPIVIEGLPWKMAACKKSNGQHDYLSLELICNSDSLNNIWSCVADIKFTISVIIGDYNDDEPNEKEFVNQKFNNEKKSITYDQVMPWETYANAENGFVSNDKSIFNAHITVKNVFGNVRDAFYEAKKRWEEISDGVVVIGDKRIKVYKGLLSLKSTYFHTMFNGGFSEMNSDEVTLEDVDFDEFTEMLDVIIDPGNKTKMIQGSNVASILRMADMFDIRDLVSDCVDFLMNSDYPEFEKFRLASIYNLSSVQEKCLQSLNSLQKVVQFAKSPNFTELSVDTQLLVLYRIIHFLP